MTYHAWAEQCERIICFFIKNLPRYANGLFCVIISFAVHLLKIDARSFKNIFPSWLSLLYFNPHFERLCLCFLLLIIFEHSTDYRLVAWSLVKLSVDRSPYPYKRKGFRVKVYEKDVLFRGWNWAMRICESVARFDSSSFHRLAWSNHFRRCASVKFKSIQALKMTSRFHYNRDYYCWHAATCEEYIHFMSRMTTMD